MYLIVGIDPGTTTGIAALNFEGELVHIFSSKDFGLDRVIGHLIHIGRVSLIATDVNPAPEFVSKLVTKLGSGLFLPEESLRIDEKIRLTKDYKVKNSHERDALSAAINAFNRFKNKFEKIDMRGYKDDVKHMVVQGISIENAIEKLKEKEIITEKPEILQPVIEISEEERRIRSLEKQNARLKEVISEKEEEIERLRFLISNIKRRYEIKIRRITKSYGSRGIVRYLGGQIENLNNKLKGIDKLKELWQKTAKKELVPVGVFPEVSSGIVLIKRKLKGVDLENLGDIEIAFVENPPDRNYLGERGIVVADPGYVKEISGCFYITTNDLNEIWALKKISLDRIIENYRKERIN